HRLDRFDAGERAAIEAAAVLGREVALATLAAALGAGIHDARARLARPLLAGVVEEVGERLRFAHALFRERVLADLAPDRRAARAPPRFPPPPPPPRCTSRPPTPSSRPSPPASPPTRSSPAISSPRDRPATRRGPPTSPCVPPPAPSARWPPTAPSRSPSVR